MPNDFNIAEFPARLGRRSPALGAGWIALTGLSVETERPDVAWRRLSIALEEARHLFVEKQRLKTDFEIAANKVQNARDEVREREVDYELFLSGLPPEKIVPLERIFFWLAASKKLKRIAALENAAVPVKAGREKLAALENAAAELSAKIAELEVKAEKIEGEIAPLETAYLKSVCAGFAAAGELDGWGAAYAFAADWLLRDRRRPELIILMWFARLYAEENQSALPGSALGFSQLAEIMDDAGEKAAALAMHPDAARRNTGLDDSGNSGGEIMKPLFELLRVIQGALPEHENLESPVRELASLVKAALEIELGTGDEKPADLDAVFSAAKDAIGAIKAERNTAIPGFDIAISRSLDAAVALCAYAFLRGGRPGDFLRLGRETGLGVTKDHPDALAMTALCTLAAGGELSPELVRIMKSAARTRLLWYTLALAGTGAVDLPPDGGYGGLFIVPVNGGGKSQLDGGKW